MTYIELEQWKIEVERKEASWEMGRGRAPATSQLVRDFTVPNLQLDY
jgi:hypothetical protein